ncbi:phage tail protein [bacterium]|nr:phage tail protein [bacterium]
MAVENATTINQLDVNLPSSTDPESEGDDHIRLIKRVFRNTFPNITAPVTATSAELNISVPIGMIMLWSGAANTIPVGWHLCDGTVVNRSDTGTIACPDLRDRFVIGAGIVPVNTTGGSISPSATTSANGGHSHSASSDAQGYHGHGGATAGTVLSVSQLPPHDHGFTSANVYSGRAGGLYFQSEAVVTQDHKYTESTGSGEAHNHGIYGDGLHAHNISVNGVGDHTHVVVIGDARPPYYALCYVIKI